MQAHEAGEVTERQQVHRVAVLAASNVEHRASRVSIHNLS